MQKITLTTLHVERKVSRTECACTRKKKKGLPTRHCTLNAYNAKDKQEWQGAMFPIVSLLMHETRTHQQNGTGHDYEPTRKNCTRHEHARTHAAQTCAAEAKVLSSSDFFAAGLTHRWSRKRDLHVRTHWEEETTRRTRGTVYRRVHTQKEKCSHFFFSLCTSAAEEKAQMTKFQRIRTQKKWN